MNIIGILKYFISEVHPRSTYSDFCLSIGVVLFIGIVPYQAVIHRDVRSIIIWYGNTGMWVPESRDPIDAVTILIGPYVRGSANIFAVLAGI